MVRHIPSVLERPNSCASTWLEKRKNFAEGKGEKEEGQRHLAVFSTPFRPAGSRLGRDSLCQPVHRRLRFLRQPPIRRAGGEFLQQVERIEPGGIRALHGELFEDLNTPNVPKGLNIAHDRRW